MSYDLTYISLGAGVQSTAVLVMSALGLHGCPRADVAIFADTGDEPAYVYEHLETLEAWSLVRGISVVRVRRGHLSADILSGIPDGRPPLFLRNPDGSEGMLRRQCTDKYKIRPIQTYVRGRLPKGGRARCLLGISLDEAQRMRDSYVRYIENAYPLIDARLRRGDCERLIAANGLPVPSKSACVYCPFHDERYWRFLRTEHPADFARAVAFDAAIRGGITSVVGAAFVHRRRIPLADVPFGPETGDLFANECAGVCGV